MIEYIVLISVSPQLSMADLTSVAAEPTASKLLPLSIGTSSIGNCSLPRLSHVFGEQATDGLTAPRVTISVGPFMRGIVQFVSDFSKATIGPTVLPGQAANCWYVCTVGIEWHPIQCQAYF